MFIEIILSFKKLHKSITFILRIQHFDFKSLKLYYQNTRGLRTKIIRGLKNKFTLANFDCIALTETWLNDNFSFSEIFDDTYNVFRSDRSTDKYNALRINKPNIPPGEDVLGGGCLIALKSGISALRVTEWEDEVLFDNVWI